MSEPILVIMAAGMGSRYGGQKQIVPVGENGEIIIDYSLYDAWRAGFRRVVCVTKEETAADLQAIIRRGAAARLEVDYAFQRLSDLPGGYSVPEGRVKPWGTGHAVFAARDKIDAPFAVINADDYYGADGFSQMYGFLKNARDTECFQYAMVGYALENTLTENGHVSRGVCQVENGRLLDIHERTHIERRDGRIAYTEDEGKTWHPLSGTDTVSMNFWGFTPSMIDALEENFSGFLDRTLRENPLKGEYYLPAVVNELIGEQRAKVSVFRSADRWYGVTYRKDKPMVDRAIREMTAGGKYPRRLWEGSCPEKTPEPGKECF